MRPHVAGSAGGRLLRCTLQPSSLARCTYLAGGAPPQHYQTQAAGAKVAGSPLVQWVTGHPGGVVDGVDVVTDSAVGYGLTATQEITPSQLLIQLPQQATLTYNVTSDKRVLDLVNKVPQELWGARLALQVLSHRLANHSSFYEYIKLLPNKVPVPMFYGGDALAALQYPPLIEQVKKRCRWLLAFASQELTTLPGTPADPFGGQQVEVNLLGWAMAVVTSRAFRIRGPDQPAAMLPLIDMANHSFTPNAEIKASSSGAIQMVALKRIATGQPVVLNYGALSNDFLLMDYGFVVPGNPHDRIQIRFSTELLQAAGAVHHSDGDKLKPWQSKLLANLKLSGDGANLEVTAGGIPPVSARLLAATRILCTGAPENLRGRTLASLGEWEQPLLKSSDEVRGLKALVQVCTLLLAQFPSGSIEQDQQLLLHGDGAGQPLAADMCAAVTFRMEKKRTLLAAIQAIAKRIRIMQEAPTSLSQGKKNQKKRDSLPSPTRRSTSKGFG